MDYAINLHEQPFYALVKARGVASVDSFARLLEELSVSKTYPSGIGILLDLRDLDIENFTATNLKEIIQNIRKVIGKEAVGPCAAVVDNPVAFGVARMYGSYGGDLLHSGYNVFYNPDDAVLWLLGCVLRKQRGHV